MRITNKMMNNNTLRNINSNKEYLDKLNNQMASGKKIVRPSDDPVTAIRALKLRSNLSEITQYYDRNTNDANAWLQATQDAVESTKEILTSMKSKFTTGATGTNTVESRNAILSELQALSKQIYDDGNADYAGRSLFTGYRTSTDLVVQDEDLKGNTFAYKGITETFSKADMDQVTHISGKLTSDQVTNADGSVKMQDVDSAEVSRLRLAYDDLDPGTVPTIEIYRYYEKGEAGYDPDDPYKKNVLDTIAAQSITYDPSTMTYDEYLDQVYKPGDNQVYFIPQTGELILGKNVADNISKKEPDDKIEVTYNKSTWKQGDLRPEHYFDCTLYTDEAPGGIVFDSHDDVINYDISTNQQMQINTFASELYVHGIGRDIEELTIAIEECNNADAKVSKLEAKLADPTLSTADRADVQKTLDAANKEKDLVNDRLQRMFEHGLTTFSSYIEKATLAGTTVGTRIERMDLVKNRLLDLKTTAMELADKNENVEITDVVIDVNEAEMNYNAALMATGKISQQNLLNYI